jgi:hypothetical protein
LSEVVESLEDHAHNIVARRLARALRKGPITDEILQYSVRLAYSPDYWHAVAVFNRQEPPSAEEVGRLNQLAIDDARKRVAEETL